jgi:tetratricopeptide (TPR) repeat protein
MIPDAARCHSLRRGPAALPRRRASRGVALAGLLLMLQAMALLAGEKEAPAFVESARGLAAKGDSDGLRRRVGQERGTAYEAVDLLLAGKEPDSLSLAEVLARAYEQAFSDRCLVERVALFRSWTPAQRALRSRAMTLKEQGKAAYGKGQMQLAVARFKEALVLFREAGDAREEGRCLSNLGSMAAVQGEADAERRWSSAARETVTRSGDLSLQISMEINHAFIQEDRGELEAARISLESALKAARDWNDREGEASVLVNLGSLAEGRGDFAECIRLAREQARVGREIGSAEVQAVAWNNLAAGHLRLKDYDAALKEMETGLAIARRAGLTRRAVELEEGVVEILRRTDRLAEALKRIAHARATAAGLDDSKILAQLDLDEASVRVDQGRFREALPLFDAARKRVEGAEAASLLSTLFEGRAIALYYLGRYSEAVSNLRLALRQYDILSRAGMGATAYRNLALCHFALGETRESIRDLETASKMHRQVDDDAGAAEDLDALGVFRFRSGDLEGARAALQAAIGLLPEAASRKLRGDLLADLAAVELASSPARRAAGLEMLREASATFLRDDDLLGVEQTATQTAEAALDAEDLQGARAALSEARHVAAGRRPAEYEWKMLYLEGRVAEAEGDRGRTEDRYAKSVAEVERLRESVAPSPWRAAILEDRIEPYRAFCRWKRRQGRIEEAYRIARMAKARTFVEGMLPPPPLTGEFKGIRDLSPAPLPAPSVEAASLRARLAPGDLLLDFFFEDTGLVIFLVDAKRLEAVEIPDSRPSAMRGQLELLKNPGRPDAAREAVLKGWLAAAGRAGDRLFGPILPRMLSSAHLFIVPNGALHGIPFAALRVEGRPLVDRWSLSLLPAAEALREPREWKSGSASLLAVGNPFTVGAGDRPLPGAALEARAVARRAGPAATLRLGSNATEAEFRRQAPRFPWIHLAAHGRTDPLAPSHSYIQLAPGGEEDGRLEAMEIASMKLPADLVVLSGCDTAREGGTTRGAAPGDERAGLSRAFLAAGVRSVIGSLWELDDQDARFIMPELYRLLESRPPSEALAELQLRLMRGVVRGRQGRLLDHPFYWAGLTAYGAR